MLGLRKGALRAPGRGAGRVYGRLAMTARLGLAAATAGTLAAGTLAYAATRPAAMPARPVRLASAAVAARDGAYVRLDQLAIAAGRPGEARVLSRRRETGAPFTVADGAGRVVARGRVGRDLGPWSARFPHVARLTLPALGAGDYVVRVAGREPAVSAPVHAGDPPALARPVIADALRFFATQHDGDDVAGAELTRGPTHLADRGARQYAVPRYRGDRLVGGLHAVGGPVDVSGGWFDAGDDIKFLETASFADAMLLWTARDHGAAFGADAPALLREARFGTDWLLKMTGDGRGAIRYQVGLGDGNAHVTGAHDADWGLPERDDGRGERPGDRGYYLQYRPALVAAPAGQPLSPNLAGRTAAALALAAQVFHVSDPAFAARCLAVAERVYARARTTHVGTLLTTSPHTYYDEVEWRDDMELGAAELARATGSRHYVALGAHWADAYLRSPLNGTDTLNLYDVGALAHLELGPLLHDPALPVSRRALAADLGEALAHARALARHDPFGLGTPVRDGDSVQHAFGLALEAQAYDALARTRRLAAFAAAQRDWALGDNPWGLSFVVGGGSVFPQCLHSPIANLRGSLDGRPPILAGATVAGPAATSDLRHLGVADGARPCSVTRYAGFSGRGAAYADAVAAASTNEPADDATALALAALAAWS
jgi:endoglucanase